MIFDPDPLNGGKSPAPRGPVTGKEPDPETLRKIKAGERTGPFDFVRVVVDPPRR